MGSSIDFGHDFGPIFADFARILDGFSKDFGRISGPNPKLFSDLGPKWRPTSARSAPRAPQEAPRGLLDRIFGDFGIHVGMFLALRVLLCFPYLLEMGGLFLSLIHI